jgi:hypothetical protein
MGVIGAATKARATKPTCIKNPPNDNQIAGGFYARKNRRIAMAALKIIFKRGLPSLPYGLCGVVCQPPP